MSGQRQRVNRQRQRVNRQRQRAILREGATITREDGSHPYIIWCAKCDYYTTAVSAKGMLVYREAVKLANRHICGQ